MQSVLVLTIVGCMIASSSAFFLTPSIYNSPPANKTVCYFKPIDASAAPTSPNPKPYFGCVNQNRISIIKCTLQLSTPSSCPLQFSGTYQNNAPVTCTAPNKLINTDCTAALKQLCDTQDQCVFRWGDLPNLGCLSPSSYDDDNYSHGTNVLKPVPNRSQEILVEYKCNQKRSAFRPFGNKRYSNKFHPNIANPLRKMSYNRLQQL